MKIIGLSGSLRKASFNTALLRAMQGLVPDGVEFAVETVHGIPLYDGDLENSAGIPPAVEKLKQAIIAADGLILSTPEYNGSMPGVLKNAIDWLSRPPSEIAKVFQGRPVGLIGASPGGFGTILGQNACLPVLHALGMRPWYGARILASRAHNAIDASGAITDAALREQLRQFVLGFADFICLTAAK
jgi:chromate reductase, NAD(P)H dehydrogenase (quinone)